jgi:RNA polymerase sigma-70 factor (ECF subfamily)
MVIEIAAGLALPIIQDTMSTMGTMIKSAVTKKWAEGRYPARGETTLVIRPETAQPDHPAELPTTLDGQTFDQFFRAHYETIRRRAYAAGLDLELAEDVTQEAMIIAAQFWERISVMEHPVAYVATTAINILRRVRRKEASLRAALDQAHPDQQLGAMTPGPENAVVNRIDLEHALRFIPAEQAECFVLHHMFGYLNREIALALGIPEGTVKSRVHAARAGLREILGDDTMGGFQ